MQTAGENFLANDFAARRTFLKCALYRHQNKAVSVVCNILASFSDLPNCLNLRENQ